MIDIEKLLSGREINLLLSATTDAYKTKVIPLWSHNGVIYITFGDAAKKIITLCRTKGGKGLLYNLVVSKINDIQIVAFEWTALLTIVERIFTIDYSIYIWRL
jgi:hypothetical protein